MKDVIVQGKVTGIIYPPPDMRAIVDKTAVWVARNGAEFEQKIAAGPSAARFPFLKESDPYHAYYRHKVNEFAEQKSQEDAAPAAAPASTATATATADHSADKTAAEEAKSEEKPAAETPIVKAAEGGDVLVEKKAVEAVTAKLAKKMKDKVMTPPDEEMFKIKHPTLSALDQEIMYLTAQYTALNGSSFIQGLATREQRNPQFDFLKPTHALFAYFTALVESYTQVLAMSEKQMKRIEAGMDRMTVLDRCVHKLEWVRQEQEKKDKEAAENDAEKFALAQIDWHDFVVVETITFDDADDAPVANADDSAQKGSDDEDMDMDEDSDDEAAAKPDIKVVEDYVPQAAPATASAGQPMINVDGKAIPTSEANEHMRILLMNPKWREETQRHLEKQKESSYAPGSAIADSLKRFANRRADIFSSSAEEEARLLRASKAAADAKVAEQEAADEDDAEAQQPQTTQAVPGMPPTAGAPGTGAFGHHGVPGVGGASGMPGPPGIPPMHGAAPGMPGFPPSAPGMVPPPGVPAPHGMMTMGLPGMMRPPGMMPPPGMFPPGTIGPPGVPVPGPPGVPGAPGAPGMLPPGVTAPVAGATGGDEAEPVAKRQRVDGPNLLTEAEFAALNPGNVRLAIKVPQDTDNAQWKLEGQTINVEVDIKDTIRTVKEKLSVLLGGMPINKQQLKATVGFLKDSLSCAHYNFANGTPLELTVRQRGGRR
ncbi:TPA: hypothetical protein N0F65_006702 [Lagenidium giganteum]|uniref:Splicing factor 3 subunit 1 n=1 Tax=Lagenidium giganteum TaxID=4803 RepID=A0AAV2Z8W4_9STRA|nr:TPA: hypothetical protein N0F65_006702 [Lagenidium giganteum]